MNNQMRNNLAQVRNLSRNQIVVTLREMGINDIDYLGNIRRSNNNEQSTF